jgi:type IV secretory pathway VirB10-like protein
MSIKSTANKLISIACLTAAGPIFGQSIDDYFHSAAQLFIHAKDTECKKTIDEGLAKYPNDPKLLTLKSKIKDQKKQDDKKQDQQKKDDQQQSNKDQNQDKQKQEPTPQQQKQEDMKKEDAKRLIEQFSDDEKDLNKKPEKVGILKNKNIEKDW